MIESSKSGEITQEKLLTCLHLTCNLSDYTNCCIFKEKLIPLIDGAEVIQSDHFENKSFLYCSLLDISHLLKHFLQTLK